MSRQRFHETDGAMLDRLMTELQGTGKCRIGTLSVAEISGMVETLGLYADECFVDVAGWLYVKKRVPASATTTSTEVVPEPDSSSGQEQVLGGESEIRRSAGEPLDAFNTLREFRPIKRLWIRARDEWLYWCMRFRRRGERT